MDEISEADVVRWLRGQRDKKLVEVFYEASSGRTLAPLDKPEYESHFVIAHVLKNSDTPADWEIEFIGLPEPAGQWPDEALLTKQGEHCFQTVVSFADEFRCPLCGEETSGA